MLLCDVQFSRCIDNYSKISGNSYQLCRDEPESIKFKSKLLDNTNNAGVIDAKKLSR